MMRTADADEMIAPNPCVVERGGAEHSPERPVLTVAQVGALADANAPRFRVLVLVSASCGLRRGELLALSGSDFDVLHKTLRAERALSQLVGGTLIIRPAKTEASARSVVIPPHTVADLVAALDRFVDGDRSSLMFTREKGGPVRPLTLQKVRVEARSSVGIHAPTSPDTAAHIGHAEQRVGGRCWGLGQSAEGSHGPRQLGRGHPSVDTRRPTDDQRIARRSIGISNRPKSGAAGRWRGLA
jgi:integrase